MTATAIIQHYNRLNGNNIKSETLRKFHAQVQRFLDADGHGPMVTDIRGIHQRITKLLKKQPGEFDIEKVKLIPIDLKEVARPKPTLAPKKEKRKTFKPRGKKKVETIDREFLAGLECIQNDAGLSPEALGEMGATTYQVITDKILSLMKSDGLIWRKPWNENHQGKQSHAHNYVTKRYYRGTNFYLNYLLLAEYKSPYFLTFNQVDQLGGKVKKGEQGHPVIYFKELYKDLKKEKLVDERTATSNGKLKPGYNKFPSLFYYKVFNAEQCEGLKLKPFAPVKLTLKEKIESCEAIVAAMPQRPKITNAKGDRAFYRSSTDSITLPLIDQFKIEQQYYSVAFHEMVHSTGAPHRIGRNLTGRFGSKSYAFEELIAELGASYLCGESGVLYHTMKNSAAYVKNWSTALRHEMENDPKFFLRAAAAAEKASEFILDRKTTDKPAAKKKAKQRKPARKLAKKVLIKINKNPKTINGLVDASELSDIVFKTYELDGEWKNEFNNLNSDTQGMFWGSPGSGKTVKQLRFAQYLAEKLNLKTLYLANEEFGRSSFAEKITEFNIGHPILKFAKKLDESLIDQFDVIFFDSINSMGLTLDDYKVLRDRHPGKMYWLIVQSTKDGDFRGGKDWEHEVDIAVQVVNRKLIFHKNRFDKDNARKKEEMEMEEAIAGAKKKEQIRKAIKGAV